MAKNDDILHLDISQRRFIRNYKIILVLTVISAIGAVLVNMVIVSNLREYAVDSQQWVNTNNNVYQVQLHATRLNIPGNSILSSHDVKKESQAADTLFGQFNSSILQLKKQLSNQLLSPLQLTEVQHKLFVVDSLSLLLLDINKEIINGDIASKVSVDRMIELDRLTGELNTELSLLSRLFELAERNDSHKVVGLQEQYSAILNVIGVIALVIVIIGGVYGAKLSGIMKKNSVNRYKQYRAMMGSFDKNQQLLIDLEASEKKIRRITNTIPGTVCQYRISRDMTSMNFLYMSDSSEKLFGYTSSMYLNDSGLIQRHVPAEHHSEIMRRTKEAIQNKTVLEIEFPYDHPVENRQIWIHGTAYPEEIGNGFIEMYSIFTDVTDVKVAIGALHSSEKQLLDISHAIPGVVYQLKMHTSGHREYLFISSGTAELFGLSSDEITRNPYTISDRIHNDDLAGIGERITVAMQSLSIYEYEYRYIMPNGSERWISELSIPEQQDDGSIIWSGILTDSTERKLQQNALRHNEEMLNEAQSIAQLGSWELDMKTGAMWWSTQMYKISGFNPDAPSPDFSKVMLYNVLKRDIRKWYKSVVACIGEESKFDWDMDVVTDDGEKKIFHIMGKVATDETGRIVKILGTALDITERTRIQEDLQRANTVVENSTSVLFRWEYNPDWRMTYISTNIKQWGYQPEELIGSTKVLSSFVHPDDKRQLEDSIILHQNENNTRYTLEYRLKNKEGVYRWVEERNFATYDNFDNRVVKIEGIITDINDRKVAEEQLQSKMLELHRQDYLLKVTAESLKQIVTTTEEFEITMERAIGQIAEAMETDRILIYETSQIENSDETFSILQYSWSRIENEPQEVFKNVLPKRIGLDTIALSIMNGEVFRQNLDAINTKAKRLLKLYGVESIVAIPIFLRNKFWGFMMMHDCKKQRQWLDFEVNVLTGAAASMAGSIERNRAERKLKEYTKYLSDAKSKLEVQANELLHSNKELSVAREIAETSNRSKSAFLSSMSHELRTPLNAVLGFTQILKKDEQLSKQQHKYLDTMYNSGQHLLAMINDILDVSKIEAGRIELQYDYVSIQNFCTEISSMFQVRCGEKQQIFTVTKHGDVPEYVRADVVRLRQVMINLIGNATKFTPVGGSIAVVINCISRYKNENDTEEVLLRFEVRDTGRGIPDNQMNDIFEPFRQVNGMHSEGTGLGLAISSKLVSLMQGAMKVQSTVNVGSVFSFELPFEVTTTYSTLPHTSNHTIVALDTTTKCSVLLVDDILSNREVIRGMLEPLGIVIYEATNGAEALELLDTIVPDIVFLDLLMPVMGGEETINRIRQQSQFAELPVIAITASGFDGKREEVINTGFDEYIRKPFRAEELFMVLERFTTCKFVYKTEDTSYVHCADEAHTNYDNIVNQIVHLIKNLPEQTSSELQNAIEIQDFDAVNSIIGSIELFDDSQKMILSELGNAASENNFRLFLEMSNSLN